MHLQHLSDLQLYSETAKNDIFKRHTTLKPWTIGLLQAYLDFINNILDEDAMIFNEGQQCDIHV